MDIPIIHTITVIAPTLTATFPFITIWMGFIISVVVTTRLAIGEEDTDPLFLKGRHEARPSWPRLSRSRNKAAFLSDGNT